MRYILVLLIFATSFASFAEEKIEELEQYDIRSYAPQKSGVKDLVFEARIDRLTEVLQKNLSLGKLTDVSFKVYWVSPSQYKIEVHGLPKGFEEVKSDLIQLLRGKLEFVLPESFSEKFKGYTLKAEPVADGKLIRAIDLTYTLAVPEIDIFMDKNGSLKKIETRAPLSAVKTEFFHSPKSWSNNKLVLDKIVLTSGQNGPKMTSTSDIDYVNVNGVGFPSKVTIKNIAEVQIPAKDKEKAKIVKNENGSVIRFTKYEVNTGKALRHMESAK